MATTEYGSSATFRVSAQLAMKNGLNVETLTGTFTLTKQSATFQKLDPGGASRNVVLPAISPSFGPFLVENTADAAENLVVKAPDGTTTIATLARGEVAWFMVDTDGTDAWVAVDQHGSTGDASLVGDTVSELTAAAGVTVDGLLIKDGKVDLNGVAGALILDADADTLIGASTDDEIDVTVSGAADFKILANTFRALSGSSIETDTIAETTATSGVTVDGCLIKDGRAASLAVAAMFGSTEQTGTGGSQTVAHGLGSTPTLVWVCVTEDPAGTGFDVAMGAHDVTNIVVTVTTGVKFIAYAIK